MNDRASQKPTIRDVALAAGVSTASVSYVLNGRGKVAAETAQRIRQVMHEMGYRARTSQVRADNLARAASDADGKALSARGQVLFLASDPQPGASRTYQLQRIAAGAEAWMEEFSLEMILGRMGYAGQVPLCLENPSLNGVILRGPAQELSEEQCTALKARPCVEFFGQVPHDMWDQVSIDNVALAHDAAKFLMQAGCERVVILNPDDAHEVFYLRASTLEFRLRSRGVPCDMRVCRPGESLAAFLPGIQNRERLGVFVAGYNATNPPTVVEESLLAAGLHPRQNVPVLGVSPVPLGHATLYISLEGLGRNCAEQLIWRMQHPKADTRRILMKPVLREGEATGIVPPMQSFEPSTIPEGVQP